MGRGAGGCGVAAERRGGGRGLGQLRFFLSREGGAALLPPTRVGPNDALLSSRARRNWVNAGLLSRAPRSNCPKRGRKGARAGARRKRPSEARPHLLACESGLPTRVRAIACAFCVCERSRCVCVRLLRVCECSVEKIRSVGGRILGGKRRRGGETRDEGENSPAPRPPSCRLRIASKRAPARAPGF